MAEVKHTPGPWEALPWEAEAGGRDWNVWGPQTSNHVGDRDLQGDFGSEDDARLIAAAPETAAERDALRIRVGNLEVDLRAVNAVNADLLAALNDIARGDSPFSAQAIATAAIAKATGQDGAA